MAFKLFKKKLKKPSLKRKRRVSSVRVTRSPYTQKISFSSAKPMKGKRGKKRRFKGNMRNPRRIPFKALLIIITSLTALIGGTYFIFFSNTFNLKEWEIIEKDIVFENHPLNEIVAAYQDQNILFINTNEIQDTVTTLHPDIEHITVRKHFPKKITIELHKYPLAANIINIIGEENIEKKLIINRIGTVVEEDSSRPDLPYLKVKSTKAFAKGEVVIDEEQLNNLLSVVAEFEEMFGMKIIDSEYHALSQEFHLRTEKKFMIWLDMSKDYEKQFLKLKKVLPKLDIFKEPLLYIDLRISGLESEKVIYKRR